MLQFLLTLADESDHSKIEDLYNKYHEFMIKFSVSKLASMNRKNCLCDAEDAVQNTFIKIVRYIDRIDFSRSEKEIKNYIFSMLTNEIFNISFEKEPDLEFDENVDDICQYTPIEELEFKDGYNRVVKAIEDLDEIYSSTMFLVFSKEMSIAEIADFMGISQKTVYTRLTRGKSKLMSALKGADIEDDDHKS